MKLGRFCALPGSTSKKQDFLCKPFSTGGFTYATDGHIAIRIPETPGAVAYESPPTTFDIAKIFQENALSGRPRFLLRHNLPEPTMAACDECEGRGKVHPCPSCKCECFYCDGTKFVYGDSTDTGVYVFDSFIATRYFRLILELKELRIGAVSPNTPIPFTFQHGYYDCQGLMMPIKYKPAHSFRTVWTED